MEQTTPLVQMRKRLASFHSDYDAWDLVSEDYRLDCEAAAWHFWCMQAPADVIESAFEQLVLGAEAHGHVPGDPDAS